jgi:hypothetical protein
VSVADSLPPGLLPAQLITEQSLHLIRRILHAQPA